MCSVNDDTEGCGEIAPSERLSFGENTTCRSCSNKARVVLRKKDAYCRDCFLVTSTHKFRASLGKSKMMKPQDRVLVAFSGSQSTVALLHLLHSGLTEKHHKRFLFKVNVLFIEEGALFNMGEEDRVEHVSKITKMVTEFDFPLFICTLGDIFNSESDSTQLNSNFTIDSGNDKKLVDLFDSVKSMSSKEDLVYLLRKKLIQRAASQLNCTKILTGEVGNDLAVRLFTSFSLGRGDQATFDTGFCDDSIPDCKILRPLRDFLKKEIVFYNKFNNVDSLSMPTFTTRQNGNASIEKLTEKFITDLQNDFPSTIYTIFRTGEKLNVGQRPGHEVTSSCVLCNCQINRYETSDDYNAVKALRFSWQMSKRDLNVCESKDKGSCCGGCSGKEASLQDSLNGLDMQTCLCYGCSEIVNDMGGIHCLPREVIQSALDRRHFETMKKEISEFLIED